MLFLRSHTDGFAKCIVCQKLDTIRYPLNSFCLAQLCNEFNRYNLLFIGLCERRRLVSPEFATTNVLNLIYSGKPLELQRSGGVWLLLSEDARNALIVRKPHSDRIIIEALNISLQASQANSPFARKNVK